MTIAILALQGAFREHEEMLTGLGADWIELRERKDLDRPYDGLILPGGESSVQGKLLNDLGLFAPLRRQIQDGLPVLATCAGLILLAERLENDSRHYFQTLPVTVRRNAYGRQLGSFSTLGEMQSVGTVPMRFIRAPAITEAAPDVSVLAEVNGTAAAVRWHNQLALAFHPELHTDARIHAYFLRMLS